MRGVGPVLKKDFTSFFLSWTGVLAMSAFLLLAGIFFTFFLLAYSQLSMEAARRAYEGIEGLNLTRFVMGAFILNLGVLFLFMAPLLSMRSLTEEKKTGTLELLYTYPLSDLEIVLGKYLALLAQLAVFFLPTLTYLGVIHLLGIQVDFGIVCSGVGGFFLLGAAFLALGMFFSSLTENPIAAAGLSFLSLMGFWMLEWIAGFLPKPWSGWINAFSPFVYYRDFPLGVIDLSGVTYFLCAASLFFFLTLRVVETRNWRG